MDENRPAEKRRCKAMIDAGVSDPENQEGIDFCINHCPYEYCVVLEFKLTEPQMKLKKRIAYAKALRNYKVSVDDIALILGMSVRNVLRYLKK